MLQLEAGASEVMLTESRQIILKVTLGEFPPGTVRLTRPFGISIWGSTWIGSAGSKRGFRQRSALRRANAFRGRRMPTRFGQAGSDAGEKTAGRYVSWVSRSGGQIPLSSGPTPKKTRRDRPWQPEGPATPRDGTSRRDGDGQLLGFLDIVTDGQHQEIFRHVHGFRVGFALCYAVAEIRKGDHIT